MHALHVLDFTSDWTSVWSGLKDSEAFWTFVIWSSKINFKPTKLLYSYQAAVKPSFLIRARISISGLDTKHLIFAVFIKITNAV